MKLRHARTGSTGPAPFRSRRAVLIAGFTATALAAATQTSAATPETSADTGPSTLGHYAALGDSYSSGAGIPPQTDTFCARSGDNYPGLLAASLPFTATTDVTCGGAETTRVAGPQGSASPQIDAVRADTDVVTVGIGGNDMGIGGAVARCVLLAHLAPQGSPCKASYTLFGTDEIDARVNTTAPRIAGVLRAVRAKAPHARIFLVGYPAIVPDDGSACRDILPLAVGDFPWFRVKIKNFNAMLARQAAANGATYVDTYTPSTGHDACEPAGVRWIEPTDTAAGSGLHPNAAYHRSTADTLTRLLTH
ncbi:SGNH/GDSL hydrolase family protein [Streptomyces sp. SPB074]|uniref:SGNH/GDSL hydrolase family protein n=1 Tax=Streptomyces sp. (strain SPB074) TaxID=465543 RepID=UPI00017F249F|nr:SGNH/GDSL hydrolase family protein [Streptomyces sp. SPB074]EDY46657.1 vegetative cell wall protein gp1 [Streptomyces sp. SPB074]